MERGCYSSILCWESTDVMDDNIAPIYCPPKLTQAAVASTVEMLTLLQL